MECSLSRPSDKKRIDWERCRGNPKSTFCHGRWHFWPKDRSGSEGMAKTQWIKSRRNCRLNNMESVVLKKSASKKIAGNFTLIFQYRKYYSFSACLNKI